ncbi:NUMOD4 domain-containing protein [Solidesulfovibrio sp.]|uniref:NUMOD4 domain-containing protein n=1 Tax=Solidesulfovibrio sp. TaxID=2910990 RepID=UPI00262D2B05|nr:NUMOD4 domain-containing protein [Solidesulfovibrio sp.]
MEWRTIPGFETYEVSHSGYVRSRSTKHRLTRKGSGYQLYVNGSCCRVQASELVARAYPAPEEVACLRARVAELEKALRQAREGNAATAPVASPERPQPSVAAKPQAKRRCITCLQDFAPQGDERVCPVCRKTGPKRAQKRYCVVCGCLLPPGFWRRCPDHAFPEGGGHTEDDFSGSVAL